MSNYQTLTTADSVELARQRVHELEAEHFRMRLRLAEASSTQEQTDIAAMITDLERRIAIHTEAPADARDLDEGERDGRDGDDSSDTDGRGASTDGDHSLQDVNTQ